MTGNQSHSIQQRIEDVTRLEYRHTRFRMVTCITVEEAIEFYLVFARFPNEGEIKVMRSVGLENLINVMRGQGGISMEDHQALQSIIADLEVLHASRYRFVETVKQELKRFVNTVSKKFKRI